MPDNDLYTTVVSDAVGEGFYSEKRSKFYAFAHHVATLDEVRTLVASYRQKYYDARHCCYAYVLGPDGALFRANDDGEPSSTAGKPILGQIHAWQLTDVLVVVVRYYGGINLTALEAGLAPTSTISPEASWSGTACRTPTTGSSTRTST